MAGNTAIISKLSKKGTRIFKCIVLYVLATRPYLVHETLLQISKHTLPGFTKKVVLVVKEVPQANERRPKRKKVSDDQQPEASQAKKQCILSSNSVPSTRLCNLLSQ